MFAHWFASSAVAGQNRRGVPASLLVALLLMLPATVRAQGDSPPAAEAAPPDLPTGPNTLVGPLGGAATIIAVVNGDVITRADVDNRRLLFALSSGLPTSKEVLNRLAPQIVRQLIDEKLRLQEMQRRHVVVGDQEIAKAITDVEGRNNMPSGTLRRRLASDGVEMRTLVDQIRVQIGWTRVLRQELGSRTQVTDTDVAERERVLKSQLGQPEYQVSEIFVPIENPAVADDATKFADAVIAQLHEGAPFSVVAAQFSQSQTALQGGDLGWVQSAQLDPSEVRVLNAMPVGAVSNPIRVPGGLSIVTLRAKREIGHDQTTALSVRQAFLQFTTPLNPQAPTEQQRQALEQARALSASAHDCDAIEAANKRFGSGRASDPGPVTLEAVAPAMRAVLDKLETGHASQPLVAQDGIAVLMVCSREARAGGLPAKSELEDRILGERVELASRQLLQDLRRRAIIEQRA